jgi:hypothetical protein
MSTTALDQARQALTALMRLATITDRLGLTPVAVSIDASTYGARHVSVQFAGDDRASVDAVAGEVGLNADTGEYGPTLYDRKGVVDGIQWGAYCGLTQPEDDTAEVSR